MRAMRVASSPMRSRFAVALEKAINRRRSRAVGWRRAMMVMSSWSISTSIWFTRFSMNSTRSSTPQAELRQGGDGLANLRLDQAAKLHHAGRDLVEFGCRTGWRCLSVMVCLFLPLPLAVRVGVTFGASLSLLDLLSRTSRMKNLDV